MTKLESSDVEHLELCNYCISDAYLINEIDRLDQQETCDHCKNRNPVMSLLDMSEILETAMDGLYTPTDANPNFFQQMMMKDRESTYEWEREGESTSDIANDIIGFGDDKYGDYIQLILSDKHADWEMMKMGEPTPFDDEYFYERKQVYPDGMYREWRTFERIVHEESRYYSAEAKAFLDDIFDGIGELTTRADEPVIKLFGPADANNILYRGRHFFDHNDIVNAMAEPDVIIGPPPANKAASNRMNAKGISVFYGATSIDVAMAEIRPPVGSTVIMGGFRPLRDLRLLDLKALKDIPMYGSLLDPKFLRSAHRNHFFKSLVRKMTQPANPDNSDSEYLTTQVVADYLLNVPDLNLDGILFPSSQHSNGGENVVLFHKSSRLQKWDVVKGSTYTGDKYRQYADDDFEFEPHVTIHIPHDHKEKAALALAQQERLKEMFGRKISTEGNEDGRMYRPVSHEPSLSINPDDMSLHEIRAINIDFYGAAIERSTYTDSSPLVPDKKEAETIEDVF